MKIPFHKSIFTKILLAFAVCFILVILVNFIWLSIWAVNSLKERTGEEKLWSVRQLDNNISTFDREIRQLTIRLLNDDSLKNIIYSKASDSQLEARVAFFGMTGSVLVEYDYIESVCFYTDSVALLTDEQNNLIRSRDYGWGDFYEKELTGEESIGWRGGYDSSSFGFPLYGGETAIPCMSFFRRGYYGASECWLVVNVSLDYFTEMYNSEEYRKERSDNTYIIDEQGRIISHAEPDMLGVSVDSGYIRYPESTPLTIETEDNQILCYPMTLEKWTLISETPLSVIEGDQRAVKSLFLTEVTAVGVIILIFLFFWTRRIITPLLQVVTALRQLRKGALGLTIPYRKDKSDEISLLVTQFNRMSGEIERLMEENNRIAEKKREAEIQALKAQLNPHFLYNTLNTVKWMAVAHNEEEIVDCVCALGDLLQPVYRDSGSFWSLTEEQNYIMNYCRVMNYRYREHCRLQMEVPDYLWETEIPKFILQPIVENAFLYGKTEQDCLTVRIIAETQLRGEDRTLCLTVSDNGAGMEQEALRKLQESLTEEHSGKHIGLANIHQRLQLLYGGDFGLTVESRPGEFFAVTVHIPLKS